MTIKKIELNGFDGLREIELTHGDLILAKAVFSLPNKISQSIKKKLMKVIENELNLKEGSISVCSTEKLEKDGILGISVNSKTEQQLTNYKECVDACL